MINRISKKIPQDEKRICSHKPEEVDYWSRKLNISQEVLRSIVFRIGNNVDDVRREINNLLN